jgi:hypothetical protein
MSGPLQEALERVPVMGGTLNGAAVCFRRLDAIPTGWIWDTGDERYELVSAGSSRRLEFRP